MINKTLLYFSSRMKQIILLICISTILVGCNSQVKIQDIDKCQLRNTLKDDVFQLSFNLIVELSKKNLIINSAKIDIEMNGNYLGSSILAAETSPIQGTRYSLPVRVTFPKSNFKISDINKILLDGHLKINGKIHSIQFLKDNAQISTFISVDYSNTNQL